MHISKLSLLKQPNNRLEDNSLEPLENNFGNLIPIKLDLEIEGKRLREIFFWDKNEPYLTIESFAKIIMEEHDLGAVFEADIISQMKR